EPRGRSPDMIKTALLAFAFAAATATSANAGAQAYLSRTGASATCTPGAPCNQMTQAVAVAGVGGEVICLDKNQYGGVLITKSVTISCGAAPWEAPPSPVATNPPAGSAVVIKGLVLDALGAAGTFLDFHGQGSLHLHNVRIGNRAGSAAHA